MSVYFAQLLRTRVSSRSGPRQVRLFPPITPNRRTALGRCQIRTKKRCGCSAASRHHCFRSKRRTAEMQVYLEQEVAIRKMLAHRHEQGSSVSKDDQPRWATECSRGRGFASPGKFSELVRSPGRRRKTTWPAEKWSWAVPRSRQTCAPWHTPLTCPFIIRSLGFRTSQRLVPRGHNRAYVRAW